uniref:Uncharacterized protein n=1 Tax=Glossina austeni TaxID=7395 RepID=A0A1A9VGF2_GLOAU
MDTRRLHDLFIHDDSTIKIVAVKVHRMEVLAKNLHRHCDTSDTAFKIVLEAVDIKQFCTGTGLEELLQYSQKDFSVLGKCSTDEQKLCEQKPCKNYVRVDGPAIYSIKLLALNVTKDSVDNPNMGA